MGKDLFIHRIVLWGIKYHGTQPMDILQGWMASNPLWLNLVKTQLISLGTPQQLSKIDLSSLT